MKGIILAGGSGTRLHPITLGTSKQLINVARKPMIYYPLSTLMAAGIKDILIITTPEDQDNFKRLLGDGSNWGISLTYAVQPNPDGLAQAFIIGEDFIGDDKVALILGDNVFHGAQLDESLKDYTDPDGGVVFALSVTDPERYGVVEFDGDMQALSIEEKPTHPKSNYAVVGLYFYDNDVIEIAKNVQPSDRGELEITSINAEYLRRKKLVVKPLGKADAWFDSGTHDSLEDTTDYVKGFEKRSGLPIGSPEVVAFEQGFISQKKLLELAEPLMKSGYGEFLAKAAGK